MATLAKLRWVLNRLASMSPPEIAHRIKERRRRSAGRAMAGWQQFTLTNVQLAPFKINSNALQDLHKACGDAWTDVWETAVNRRWHYLGVDWPGPKAGQSAWHIDPVSQSDWPHDTYCFDVDFRHQDSLGDVKYIWELNRLQFLPPIAALSQAKGDEAARRYCIETILDWADANPPFNGVNWASGIELALRAISILTTVSIIGPDTLSRQELDQIGAILNAHAVWLMRYPSLYSSANNHVIAEAAGLYVLGALVPSLPCAAQYRAYGRKVLIAEVEKQIHADGVGAEQSPTYTAFVLELYATVLAVAPVINDAFPPLVGERLSAALKFLCWITDSRGNQPRFGDDDEGRVFVSLPGHEKHYVASIMSCLADATGRPDLAPPILVPHLRDLFLGTATSSEQPQRGVRSFDDGGYSVFRQSNAGHDVMLVFDHGPLGYLSIAAHGHADALSVWMHVDGQPVFVDSGTYLYHSGGVDRDRFRGTGAHNTLLVNNTSTGRTRQSRCVPPQEES
jgi:hypothetical protein